MPKFIVYFRCEQILSGSIQVDADDATAARDKFLTDECEDARLEAKLDLEDSEDSVVQVDLIGEGKALYPVWTKVADAA